MPPDLGVIRRLDQLADDAGVFTMVAADQRESLRRMLGGTVPDECLTEVKMDIVAAVGAHASAILLDPQFAAAQAITTGTLPGSAGLIVSSEDDGYRSVAEGTPARWLHGWSPELALRLGATAVKLLVQHTERSPKLTHLDAQFVAQAAVKCRELALPLVLEVLVPGADALEHAERTAVIVAAARALSPYCDIYKAQFPGPTTDPEGKEALAACRAMDEACTAPWVILSSGLTYDRFVLAVETACRGGASGFLAGRAIWGDAVSFSGSRRRAALRSEGVSRLERLAQITRASGVPWRVRRSGEIAAMPVPAPDWFEGPRFDRDRT